MALGQATPNPADSNDVKLDVRDRPEQELAKQEQRRMQGRPAVDLKVPKREKVAPKRKVAATGKKSEGAVSLGPTEIKAKPERKETPKEPTGTGKVDEAETIFDKFYGDMRARKEVPNPLVELALGGYDRDMEELRDQRNEWLYTENPDTSRYKESLDALKREQTMRDEGVRLLEDDDWSSENLKDALRILGSMGIRAAENLVGDIPYVQPSPDEETHYANEDARELALSLLSYGEIGVSMGGLGIGSTFGGPLGAAAGMAVAYGASMARIAYQSGIHPKYIEEMNEGLLPWVNWKRDASLGKNVAVQASEEAAIDTVLFAIRPTAYAIKKGLKKVDYKGAYKALETIMASAPKLDQRGVMDITPTKARSKVLKDKGRLIEELTILDDEITRRKGMKRLVTAENVRLLKKAAGDVKFHVDQAKALRMKDIRTKALIDRVQEDTGPNSLIEGLSEARKKLAKVAKKEQVGDAFKNLEDLARMLKVDERGRVSPELKRAWDRTLVDVLEGPKPDEVFSTLRGTVDIFNRKLNDGLDQYTAVAEMKLDLDAMISTLGSSAGRRLNDKKVLEEIDLIQRTLGKDLKEARRIRDKFVAEVRKRAGRTKGRETIKGKAQLNKLDKLIKEKQELLDEALKRNDLPPIPQEGKEGEGVIYNAVNFAWRGFYDQMLSQGALVTAGASGLFDGVLEFAQLAAESPRMFGHAVTELIPDVVKTAKRELRPKTLSDNVSDLYHGGRGRWTGDDYDRGTGVIKGAGNMLTGTGTAALSKLDDTLSGVMDTVAATHGLKQWLGDAAEAGMTPKMIEETLDAVKRGEAVLPQGYTDRFQHYRRAFTESMFLRKPYDPTLRGDEGYALIEVPTKLLHHGATWLRGAAPMALTRGMVPFTNVAGNMIERVADNSFLGMIRAKGKTKGGYIPTGEQFRRQMVGTGLGMGLYSLYDWDTNLPPVSKSKLKYASPLGRTDHIAGLGDIQKKRQGVPGVIAHGVRSLHHMYKRAYLEGDDVSWAPNLFETGGDIFDAIIMEGTPVGDVLDSIVSKRATPEDTGTFLKDYVGTDIFVPGRGPLKRMMTATLGQKAHYTSPLVEGLIDAWDGELQRHMTSRDMFGGEADVDYMAMGMFGRVKAFIDPTSVKTQDTRMAAKVSNFLTATGAHNDSKYFYIMGEDGQWRVIDASESFGLNSEALKRSFPRNKMYAGYSLGPKNAQRVAFTAGVRNDLRRVFRYDIGDMRTMLKEYRKAARDIKPMSPLAQQIHSGLNNQASQEALMQGYDQWFQARWPSQLKDKSFLHFANWAIHTNPNKYPTTLKDAYNARKEMWLSYFNQGNGKNAKAGAAMIKALAKRDLLIDMYGDMSKVYGTMALWHPENQKVLYERIDAQYAPRRGRQ